MAASGTDETTVRSYLYIRVALIAVLLFLGVAVAYQSVRQGTILSSISAYYYTPAQAVFVGALIALGVSMIALQGTTPAEDVLLNIGGMLAPVVALVPTSRGADFRAAVRACQATGGESTIAPSAPPVDCPSTRALVRAAEANIDNNMLAMLVVGFVALALTPVLAGRSARAFRQTRIGLGVAVALYLVAVCAFVLARQQFIDGAHYAAAVGLFVCIFLVAAVNARRNRARAGLPGVRHWRRVYGGVAAAMVVAAVIGIPLAVLETFPSALFFLEAAEIVLFAVFWAVQTREHWR